MLSPGAPTQGRKPAAWARREEWPGRDLGTWGPARSQRSWLACGAGAAGAAGAWNSRGRPSPFVDEQFWGLSPPLGYSEVPQ